MNDELLERFKHSLIEVATELGIDVRQVPRTEWRARQPGAMSFEIEKETGGFSRAKDLVFPPESSPFEKNLIKALSEQEKTDKVVALMSEAAESLKVEPTELFFHPFARYINYRWGKNDKGLAKDLITQLGGFNRIRDSAFKKTATDLHVHREKLRQTATKNRRIGQFEAQEQHLLDRVEEYAKRVFNKAPKIQVCCRPKPAQNFRRVLTWLMSDLHLGSHIDSKETGFQSFGHKEQARRLAYVAKCLVEYGAEHQDETELEIACIGDIVNNLLHDYADGDPLGLQIIMAVHLLFQVIVYLASFFPSVKFRISPGNHDRFKSRHMKRAVNDKWDSILLVIAMALKYLCANAGLKNVSFHIPKTPFLAYEIFDKKIFATHGDTVFDIGNPSKTIPVEKLETQTSRINAGLKDDSEFKIFLVGHVHRATWTPLDNGSHVISNKALSPINPHGVSLGYTECVCGQMAFEIIEGVRYYKTTFFEVSKEQDLDESLDAIVKPFDENDVFDLLPD